MIVCKELHFIIALHSSDIMQRKTTFYCSLGVLADHRQCVVTHPKP